MAPTMCPAVKVTHDDYLTLLRRLRQIPGVKKVFIRSGIRFDYVVADPDERALAVGGEFMCHVALNILNK